MRLLLMLLVAVAVIVGYVVWREPVSQGGKTVSSGMVHYGQETLATLEGNGSVELEGTFVKKLLIVNGNLDAQKAHLNALDVRGRATLLDSTVSGKAEVNGFLKAVGTTFRSDLIVSSKNVAFTNCTLANLVIKKPFWSFGQQVVELKDKTICKGSIVFEGGNGKVIVSGKSQVLGSVQGALIEKL